MAQPATPLTPGSVQVIPSLTISGQVTRPLSSPWAVSLDVSGQVEVTVGGSSGTPQRIPIDPTSGHGEAVGSKPATLTLTGQGRVKDLIISDPADPASLLLHRLAELHARLAPGQFPIGADTMNRLYLTTGSNWNSGFYAGALWRAAALERRPFRAWALQATLDHLGFERTPHADLGFMYGQSSLLAWEALCGSRRGQATLCARLKRSVLAAANEQLKLAATNRRAGMIPGGPGGPVADVIVDDMMNIPILPWASRVTGNPKYARVARRHAQRTAALLVRPDGSTIQAVNFDRRTGRIVSKATHQGISEHTTWSRGQAWGVYGFAVDALDLHSRPLLRVGERLAEYVSTHLPPGGVPRWDYAAPPGAPLDVSAGVITSAGLFHLAIACGTMRHVCQQSPASWRALGRRMLGAALGYVSRRPPLGFLGSQELNQHANGCWCNGAELMFGLSYVLEAVRLSMRAPNP